MDSYECRNYLLQDLSCAASEDLSEPSLRTAFLVIALVKLTVFSQQTCPLLGRPSSWYRPRGSKDALAQPWAGAMSGYRSVDEAAWAIFNSTTSRPFNPPDTDKIAAKVIHNYRDEVLEVFYLAQENDSELRHK